MWDGVQSLYGREATLIFCTECLAIAHAVCCRVVVVCRVAAEDNELTFDPDDVITNITQIDEVQFSPQPQSHLQATAASITSKATLTPHVGVLSLCVTDISCVSL
jgi:hypothetical protein